MIRQAALYLATPDDLRAARLPVAGRPLAFRIVMAAVRGGMERVAVPAVLRDPRLESALARMARARAAVVWLSTGTPAPAAPTVLLPAATLITAPVVTSVAGFPPARTVAGSLATDAPVTAVTPELIRPLWPALARGDGIGPELARAVREAGAHETARAGLLERITTPASLGLAEQDLLATLGSAIDTRLDRVFHRRLSRPVTRWAMARGVSANAITVTSIAVGLLAALAIASDGAAAALVGLALYAGAVVLDHADGEVARLACAESAFGEWLDIAGDTLVHAALVVGMGVSAERAAGAGEAMGLMAAAGVVASAWVAKTAPPAADAINRAFAALGNRDGFYAMLLGFVLGLAVLPDALPALMVLVAVGTHTYWMGSVLCRIHRG